MEKQMKFPYQFFVVTFLWSWLCWLPVSLEGAGLITITMDKNLFGIIRNILILLGIFGPGVGAFYCLRTRNGKGAVGQYLRGLLDLRLGWITWFIPMVLFGAGCFLGWIIPEFWGEPRLPLSVASFLAIPVSFLFMTLLGGGQEELGWRGYILDFMEERFGPWLGNLVLGVIWSVWHLPLFFTPFMGEYYFPFVAFMLFCIGFSFILSWLRQASGKRLMAGIYTHGVANTIMGLFPILVMKENVTQSRFWVCSILMFLVGISVMFIRMRKTSAGSGLKVNS